MHGRPERSASQRARATALAALCSVYRGPRKTPTCCPVTTQVVPGLSSAAMASSRADDGASDAACRCSSPTTPCIVRRRPARSTASSQAPGSIGRAGSSDAASSSPAMNCAKKSEAMPDCTVPVPMHPSKRARRAVLAPMALTLLLSTANAAPTLRPSQPDGARLERWLDRLLVVGGVLYVAAHPDDENTRLLAYLSNHSLLRTGYLSVTRGDGGQNLIGPELGPGLGLIRTQELLAARALDGAEQLFTRARDFGYSKSPEESLRIWGKDAMLADVVLAIRRLRPDVIITRFPLEARETHGQHTASARLAVEAFTLAADPAYMPDAEHQRLGPWKARRVVWNESGFFGKTDAQLAALPHLDVGGYDAWLGLSYPELAADSRSNHRSQGFGAPRRRGPILESFQPLGGEPMKTSPLDGVVADWSRVPGSARLVTELKRARQAFRTATPEASIPALLAARAELRRMPENPWKQAKLAELDATVLACAGLFGDAVADRTSTSPGGTITLTTTVLLRRPAKVALTSARLGSRSLLGGSELKAGVPVEAKTSLEVPADTRLSNPAWLEAPEAGLYPVSEPAWIGLPEEPAPLEAEL